MFILHQPCLSGAGVAQHATVAQRTPVHRCRDTAVAQSTPVHKPLARSPPNSRVPVVVEFYIRQACRAPVSVRIKHNASAFSDYRIAGVALGVLVVEAQQVREFGMLLDAEQVWLILPRS